MARCRNCGHTEKMCKCSGGRMRPNIRKNKGTPTPTPEPSYENGFPVLRGELRTDYNGPDRSRRYRPSALTPPSFYIDPIDPKNNWAYDQYRGAQEWEEAGDFMEQKNNGGLVVEQTPDAYVSYREPLRDYEYGRFPRGLVEGRKLFGMPGGRSPRGVGTAKSMMKAMPYPPPPRPNPNVTEPYPDEDHYFGGGLRPGRNPRITNRSRKPTRKQSAYPPMGPEVERYFRPGLRFMGPVGKSMHKGSISVPDKLKSMINGLLGVGRFDNVSPAAVAAALIANKRGGSSGMKDYPAPGTSRASASRSSAAGPRKQDITLNALIRRQIVRDPENPYFNPFKQRETLRRERMPSSGSGLDKSMMKSTMPPEPIDPRRGRIEDPWFVFGRGRKPNVGGSRGMMKSISSMNQGGVRHVVGGYRGGKMSKAMAASQTQTKNRYM